MNVIAPAPREQADRRSAPAAVQKWAVSHIGKLAAIIAVLAGLGILAWRQFGAPTPVEYVTAPVTLGAVARTAIATGSVNPVLTITVGTYVSGVIQSLSCDFNTRVKKGQLCAKIDPRPYQTIVDQDRASLATARAQVAKDRANLVYMGATRQRYLRLFAQNAASHDALDNAISNAAQAEAQVELDQASVTEHAAALDAADVNLGYTNIVSPVDGTVVSRNVTMGQTVAASFQTPTLFLIATDLANMEVDTNVSESDVGAVKVGNRAQFTVEAFPEHVFTGTVTQVRQSPQTVQNVVTYDAVVAAPNPALLLMPGMTATVRIVTQERRGVLRVPNQALRYVPGGLSAGNATAAGSQVWVMRDGKPVRVAVVTGLDDDTATEIREGTLKAGDRVVVSERGGTAASASSASPALRF